jgi:hypothetical protein
MFNIFYKCTFPASQSFFSLRVPCVYGLPMQIGKQGGGMDLFVYFKIVNIIVIVNCKSHHPKLLCCVYKN